MAFLDKLGKATRATVEYSATHRVSQLREIERRAKSEGKTLNDHFYEEKAKALEMQQKARDAQTRFGER
ncbi:MAG: hypothetical protein ACI4V3_04470 [Faecousia sp.]